MKKSKTEKPKRRFVVWANCAHSTRTGRDTEVLEFDASTPQEEIDAACADALDTLIGNNFDTGWNEEEP